MARDREKRFAFFYFMSDDLLRFRVSVQQFFVGFGEKDLRFSDGQIRTEVAVAGWRGWAQQGLIEIAYRRNVRFR
jgi:hypothetical protein